MELLVHVQVHVPVPDVHMNGNGNVDGRSPPDPCGCPELDSPR